MAGTELAGPERITSLRMDAMQQKILFLTALVALAACDDATGADPGGISRDDAAALAPAYAELAEGELAAPSYAAAGEGAMLDLITTTTTFSRTRTCPVSGSVKVDGTVVLSADRAARSASSQYTATRIEQACTLNLRSGGTITINGNPSTAVTGSWSVTNGVPGIRTVTQKGSFTWSRSTGQNGTCTVDLTATWDPATHTHRVQGTFCNRTIDVTRTRS
jgi:hypothetical protein